MILGNNLLHVVGAPSNLAPADEKTQKTEDKNVFFFFSRNLFLHLSSNWLKVCASVLLLVQCFLRGSLPRTEREEYSILVLGSGWVF